MWIYTVHFSSILACVLVSAFCSHLMRFAHLLNDLSPWWCVPLLGSMTATTTQHKCASKTSGSSWARDDRTEISSQISLISQHKTLHFPFRKHISQRLDPNALATTRLQISHYQGFLKVSKFHWNALFSPDISLQVAMRTCKKYD